MDPQEYFGGAFGGDDGIENEDASSLTKTVDERWELLFDCLSDGVSRDAFDAALTPVDMNSPDSFALTSGEDGLQKFLTLLGVDGSLAHLSYRYWMEDPHGNSLGEHRYMRFDDGNSISGNESGFCNRMMS